MSQQMKKIFLPLMLFLCSSISLAQNTDTDLNIFEPTNQTKQSITKKQSNKNPLTPEKEQILNELLSRSSYQDFFNTIKAYEIKDGEYIKYLLSKSDQGHVPLYWLISDYYAKKMQPKETHKWLYISIIMTQQDSYLCYDSTAKNAPRILLRSFPDTVEITRKTPQHIQEVMGDVFFFIYNLKQRITPDWACKYGQVGVISNNNSILPKSEWNNKRQEVLKRFSDKYMN
jgi:hypothetical protein